jgi:hypothetical protein
MKVWLKGEKAGQAETFVDNLPGCPDNIRLGSDGYFWIALIQVSRYYLAPPDHNPLIPTKSITSSSWQLTIFHVRSKCMQARSPWLDLITRWTLAKRVVATFPALFEWIKSTMKGAMVAQVSEDGHIVRVLDDSQGKVINFVTSVNEFNGDIFLGSLATNFVGKLSLARVTQEQQGADFE